MPTLVGMQKVRYNKKSDGSLVEGMTLHFQEPITSQNGEGLRCFNEYVGQRIVDENPDLIVGMDYKIYYNRYQRVDGWILEG